MRESSVVNIPAVEEARETRAHVKSDVTKKQEIDTTDGDLSVVDFYPENRMSNIRAIATLVNSAKDDALAHGLKFEAYLLDMAVIALLEQSRK